MFISDCFYLCVNFYKVSGEEEDALPYLITLACRDTISEKMRNGQHQGRGEASGRESTDAEGKCNGLY